MPKVSFIIPLYNAEERMALTLESVLGQTLRDVEVLLIDDGSKDRTVEIARTWEKKDSRVRLFINEKNMGVSATRNVGLEHARGEFIRFIDGDDTIPEDSTKGMVDAAERHQADIVIGIMCRESIVNTTNFINTIRLAKQNHISKYDEDLIYTFSVCNKMFRRSLIESHQLRFQPYKHAEDGMFLFQSLQHTDRISGYNDVVYIYNKREFFEAPSATETLTEDMMNGILEISEKIKALHLDAPQSFIDCFNARILGTTLIGEYYRKIWSLDRQAIPPLLEKIKQYWTVLPDDRRFDIIRANPDLPLAEGLGDRDAILQDVRFTIVIGPGVSAAHLPMLLQSLYYQRSPSFVVVIHPSLKDAVPAYYLGMENLSVAEQEADFYDAQVEACRSIYISFIEDDVTYTYETLVKAYDRLQETEAVGGTIVTYQDGEIRHADILEYIYGEHATGRPGAVYEANNELDTLVSNKFFSVFAIRRTGVRFADDLQGGLNKVRASSVYARYRGIRFIAGMDGMKIWEKMPQPALEERLEKYAISATTGHEKVFEIVPAVKNALAHRISNKALFVGTDGELHGVTKEIYEKFEGPKEIAPAGLEEKTAVERSVFYSNYRIVFMEGFDGLTKTRVFHEGQKCYPLLNYLVSEDEADEAAVYLSQFARTARKTRVHKQRYMRRKASVYLANNKKVKHAAFRVLTKVNAKTTRLKKNTALCILDGHEEPHANMQALLEQLPAGTKVRFDATGNEGEYSSVSHLIRSIRRFSTAKYVLLDEAYRPLEDAVIRKGQQVCQLWHSAGALKKFGHSEHGVPDPESIHNGDKRTTRVSVTSPLIREDFARAFEVPVERVQATGMPQTDRLFETGFIEQCREALRKEHPAFGDRKVILFAPAVRSHLANEACYDFSKLDPDVLYKALKDDYVFVFKWPAVTYQELGGVNYHAYREDAYKDFFFDLSTEEDLLRLLAAADVLVTDYSSAVFEYLPVGKPIVYYVHDLERFIEMPGLYCEFDEYLYGPAVRDMDGLIEAIRKEDLCEEERTLVWKKFMPACDGQAAAKTRAFFFDGQLPSAANTEGLTLRRTKTSAKRPQAPLRVYVVRDRGDSISVEGVFYAQPGSDAVPALAGENGTAYPAVLTRYSKEDVYDTADEIALAAHSFRIDLPKSENAAYFFIDQKEPDQKLEATYENTSGLAARKSPQTVLGTHTVSRVGQELFVRKGGVPQYRRISRKDITRPLLHGHIRTAVKRRYEKAQLEAVRQPSLKDEIALVTIRGNALEDNLALLKDELQAPAVSFAHRRPFGAKVLTELYQRVFGSRIVVTDDYMWLYRTYPKPAGQKLVQVWHACGAFKKFGVDGTSMFPGVDALTHQYYDLVSVSSEYVRSIYAQAFDIDIDKVQALGSPRTDLLFDEKKKEAMRSKVLAKHSELQGKQVILYAPTFRDIPGIPRSDFAPRIDFAKLSAAMREDQVFALCPHPVMTKQIVPAGYDNILEIRDCTTMEMMMVSDLMITDYSSVIFEYALLKKPIVFYCYDYDDYDRDFYLDYEEDLPGELFKQQDELEAYLQKGVFKPDEREARFVEKYMSACDGHSTQRIARAIEALYAANRPDGENRQ